MADLFNQLPTRTALATIAKDFYQRGWMAGTAGNLSAHSNQIADCFWITSSGMAKGQLDSHDFILIDLKSNQVRQRFHDDAKPSAETSIHKVIYALFPDARACFHIHSVDACIATQRFDAEQQDMPLPPLEMLKGLDIWQEDPKVNLPLFENLSHVPDIATLIHSRFQSTPPQIPALMIRNHGITVWGPSLQQTFNRVEIIEFIMSYMARNINPS